MDRCLHLQRPSKLISVPLKGQIYETTPAARTQAISSILELHCGYSSQMQSYLRQRQTLTAFCCPFIDYTLLFSGHSTVLVDKLMNLYQSNLNAVKASLDVTDLNISQATNEVCAVGHSSPGP